MAEVSSSIPGPESNDDKRPADDDSGSEDEVCCRICRQDEEAGKLYCPCRCAGSIKWVHESCLRKWLEGQDRLPVCELCGYAFEFHPVYAQSAPSRLTLVDWAGAIWTSSLSFADGVLRTSYAVLVWGVALPVLTAALAQAMILGSVLLPRGMFPAVLTFLLGECLSIIGIAFLYIASLVRNACLSIVQAADEAVPASGSEADTPSDDQAQQQQQQQQQQQEGDIIASGPLLLAGDAADFTDVDRSFAEEDFLNIMGLRGNPVRALACMLVFLFVNGCGIAVLLALPLFTARAVLARLVRLVARKAGAQVAVRWFSRLLVSVEASANAQRPSSLLLVPGDGNATMNNAGNSSNTSGAASIDHPELRQSVNASLPDLILVGEEQLEGQEALQIATSDVPSAASDAESTVELVHLGSSLRQDALSLLIGYGVIASVIITAVPLALLLARLFVGRESRIHRVLRHTVKLAVDGVVAFWLKLRYLSIAVLVLLVIPCYVGHLILCFLCGPVLCLAQSARVALVNSHPGMTLLMQLFAGYSHLWGVAFLEACFIDICVPDLTQTSNFFVFALCSHRQLFASHAAAVGSPSTGRQELLPVPEQQALKLALLQALLHTVLTFLLWYVPASALNFFIGEALFPVRLVEWRATAAGTSQEPPGRTASQEQAEDMQPFIFLEVMQLYIIVLQCLRLVEGSPGRARFVARAIRAVLNRLRLAFAAVIGSLSPHQPPPPPLPPAQSPHGQPSEGEPLLHDRRSSSSSSSSSSSTPDRQLPAAASTVTVVATSLEAAQQQCPSSSQLLWYNIPAALTMLIMLAWTVVGIVLVLPLSVGRLLARQLIVMNNHQGPAQMHIHRVSDVVALTIGVVVFFVTVYVLSKVSEAFPTVSARIAQCRLAYMLGCLVSSLAMSIVAVILIPLGFGTLALRLALPFKARSSFQMPVILYMTDCWSLGLMITKVVWRMSQIEIMFPGLQREFVAIWTEVHGSFTHLIFDLHAQMRLWRCIILPPCEEIILHLGLPHVIAETLCRLCPPSVSMQLRGYILLFSYHALGMGRMWLLGMPLLKSWLSRMRQHIFDSKYLVSVELKNYHPMERRKSERDVLRAVAAAPPQGQASLPPLPARASSLWSLTSAEGPAPAAEEPYLLDHEEERKGMEEAALQQQQAQDEVDAEGCEQQETEEMDDAPQLRQSKMEKENTQQTQVQEQEQESQLGQEGRLEQESRQEQAREEESQQEQQESQQEQQSVTFQASSP